MNDGNRLQREETRRDINNPSTFLLLLSLLSNITRRSDEDLPVDWRPDLEASDPHTPHLRSNTLAPHPLWMEPRFSFARVCAEISPLLSPPPTINPFCKITSSTRTTSLSSHSSARLTSQLHLGRHLAFLPKRGTQLRHIRCILNLPIQILGHVVGQSRNFHLRSRKQIPQQLGTLIDRNCEPRPRGRSRRSD